MNEMIVVGNVTRDPEMTYSQAGLAITKFSIATNNGKDKAGKQRVADFHNITAFGTAQGKDGLAALCAQYLVKGNKVMVRGKHQINEWEKDGVKHRYCSIIAAEVEFLTPRAANANED